jgi:TPR repeat protein
VKWYRRAAAQGDANAQSVLASMYIDGRGGRRADAEGVKWYGLAAAQGDAHVQFALGSMYIGGQGVQDNAEAAKWYRRAAAQGHASAQLNLGFMHDNGQGVPRDYVRAHMWANLAGSRFAASDKERRDIAENHRNRLAAKMKPAQIAEAQRLAREWKSSSPH